jgi:hypothetical protein
MTSSAQLKKIRLKPLNPKAWIRYLVGYSSTNINRVWNPATNRVISARDVVFNEQQTFNGDIQTVKADLLHISSNELETLLRKVETPQGSETLPSCSTQNEDEELYPVDGDVQAPYEGKDLSYEVGSSEITTQGL